MCGLLGCIEGSVIPYSMILDFLHRFFFLLMHCFLTGKLVGCFLGKCSGSIRSIARHPEFPVIASCGECIAVVSISKLIL